MDINKLFRTFKRKLLLEGIGKAFLFAATFCASFIFVTSLIYHILVKEAPIWMLAVVGGGVFLICFFIQFFVRYYPTKKRIAKRIDELGLQERIGTMLEFREEDSEMVKLQRKDAEKHLQAVTAKQVKFRFSKREIIYFMVSVCLAVTMMVIPYDVFDFSEPTELTDEERKQILEDLIEELRQEVEDSELNEELKEDLNEIIDKLEEELEESESELEQTAKIDQAKKEMQELLEKAMEENPEMKEAIEELQEQLEDTLEEKKDELFGNNPNQTVEEPEQSEEEQQGEQSEEDNQGQSQEQQEGNQGMGQGQYQEGDSGEGSSMTEGIYDPILGNVPYGEVFAYYYAQYLDALEAGEVPQDLQNIMDQYFASLE